MGEEIAPQAVEGDTPKCPSKTRPWVIAALILLLLGTGTGGVLMTAFVREEGRESRALEARVATLEADMTLIRSQLERQRVELQRQVDLIATDLAELQLALPSTEDLQTRLERLENRVTALEFGLWRVDATDIVPPLGCSAGDYAVWDLFGLSC